MSRLIEDALALDDRKQRAREAFHDASGLGEDGWRAAELAIEVAVHVRVTPEIVAAAEASSDYAYVDMLKAAFAAAGFDVEE